MRPADTLTLKELKIIRGVHAGKTNREVGADLGTSEQVVKNHLRRVYDKLGVWSRLELALYVEAHKEEFYAKTHLPERAEV